MRAAALATNADAQRATLAYWLRLLWNIAPPLQLNSDLPYIAGGTVHLPACNDWHGHEAAAAHAAAHLVFSPRVFDGGGIGPIVRALMAVLEDARVEALAIRELPGLVRLWRPLHQAAPAPGVDFVALLQRLARALADPGYDDPDLWVKKGRALFYDGQQAGTLMTAAEIRTAAIRLGHDIGQMRLPFNVKTYRPAPAYRDDNRWMWAAAVLGAAPPPAASVSGSSLDDAAEALAADALMTSYPEWDRLISRVRADWCRVIERPAPLDTPGNETIDVAVYATAVRLRRTLRALTQNSVARKRCDEGDVIDPDALVAACVARRLRNGQAFPVYRALDRHAVCASVYILIDQSASTALANGRGHSILKTASAAACAIAAALYADGVPCAIAGFSSNGRHDVRVVTVKSFDAPVDDRVTARVHALRPGGSTRLGAALRHATNRLAANDSGKSWVMVLSDSEAHDIDVHDPRYLIDDARHAVRSAARLGVHVVCLSLARDHRAQAQHIFGRGRVQFVRDLHAVPRTLARLVV